MPVNSWAWAAPVAASASTTAPAKRWKRGIGKLLLVSGNARPRAQGLLWHSRAGWPETLPPLEPRSAPGKALRGRITLTQKQRSVPPGRVLRAHDRAFQPGCAVDHLGPGQPGRPVAQLQAREAGAAATAGDR